MISMSPRRAEVTGGMNTKAGYFIKEDIGAFDHELFGILNV